MRQSLRALVYQTEISIGDQVLLHHREQRVEEYPNFPVGQLITATLWSGHIRAFDITVAIEFSPQLTQDRARCAAQDSSGGFPSSR